MKFLSFALLLLTSACSLNKVYLVPYELNDQSRFAVYEPLVNDSLVLTFNNKQPEFAYQSGRQFAPGFSVESVMIEDRINAWLLKPENPNGTTIYFLHGNAGNLVYQYRLVVPFVERGFTVFMIDYQGFGFSSGKAKRKFVLQDANVGMDYLCAHPDLRGDRLIVYGQSLGGHLAIAFAKPYAEDIDVLVSEGAFASHKLVAADRAGILGKIFVKEMYSAKDSIATLRIPKLIIHSTEDKTIPYHHGELLYRKACEPKQFLQIDQRHILGPLYYADTIVSLMNSGKK